MDEDPDAPDDSLRDPAVRRQVSIIYFALGILLTSLLFYEALRGFIYARSGLVYRDTHPVTFWSCVVIVGLSILMIFGIAFASRPGGSND